MRRRLSLLVSSPGPAVSRSSFKKCSVRAPERLSLRLAAAASPGATRRLLQRAHQAARCMAPNSGGGRPAWGVGQPEYHHRKLLAAPPPPDSDAGPGTVICPSGLGLDPTWARLQMGGHGSRKENFPGGIFRKPGSPVATLRITFPDRSRSRLDRA